MTQRPRPSTRFALSSTRSTEILPNFYPFFRPLLFALAPEASHGLTFGLLRATGPIAEALTRALYGPPPAILKTKVGGVRFHGPVGLAAGLDKDGHLPGLWAALGFGAVEIGTVTALTQPGNPRPRLFRFPAAGALINRMGFNNAGSSALARRLARQRERRAMNDSPALPPIGVNLGKSETTPVEDAVDDYVTSAERLHALADYVVINATSPGPPGLSSVRDAGQLREIVQAVVGVCGHEPVFVKLAPDLADEAVIEAVAVAESAGAHGVVATNATIARHGLPDVGSGRLSGEPLRARALEVVGLITRHTALPVIAVGGISKPEHVFDALAAGASAVQLYTALIFEGPGLVHRLHRAIAERVVAGGHAHVDELKAALRAESSCSSSP